MSFILVVAFVLVKFGFAVILPFLIAWIMAISIVPIATKISVCVGIKNRRVKKFLSVFLFTLVIALIVFFFSLITSRLVGEFRHLMERMSRELDGIADEVGNVLDFFDSFTSRIPFLEHIADSEKQLKMRKKLDELISESLSEVAIKLAVFIPSFITGVMSAFPSFLLFILVTLISGFYFCADLGGIHSAIKRRLPKSLSEKLSPVKRKIAVMAVKYIRAYILIFLMTFAELSVGFYILDIDYALIIALGTAFLDILPVFGVGSVLLPWSAVLLISGNNYMGFGLLIIYACITIIRQIIEPKIVGESIGLHPLVTLGAMYAGFKLFGIVGMIFGPVAVLGVVGIMNAAKSENV